MKIACVQQNHNTGKVEENRDKAVRFAKEALANGAEIILFHEELLIGYHENMKTLAEPEDGETTNAFIKILKGTDAKIVYGLTEKKGGLYYISAPVVTGGGVIANYHKTHLWWKASGLRDETDYYTPGDSLVCFEHSGHKIGILICYDGDFPEMFRSYAKLGCAMVLWMNNRESRGPDDCCVEAARRNSLFVATTCACGIDESGHACAGDSNIVDYNGKVFGVLSGAEGIIYADVDLSGAPAARENNPLYKGMRSDLYQ